MALPNQRPTQLFTVGRACPLEAVVLHSYSSGIEVLNLEMNRCPRPRPTGPRKCHDSFHFGIGNCNFTQYVPIADTAWGFYLIPTPVCPVPPCPIVQTCDGIGVDQYNTDLDGNLPTPPVGVGPDGTANCAVIHVAVSTGISNLSVCPDFSPQAYKCLVRDLCYIFEQAGLEVISGETLLTHIGELVDLDLDQLAIDIQECLDYVPPPLPPCECAINVAITATDTPCLDLTVTEGPDNTFVITGAPIISPTIGNALTCSADGLFVPTAPDIAVNGTDTTCIDITVVESPANTFVISADPIVSPDVGNQLVCSPNGLLVPALTSETLCEGITDLPTGLPGVAGVDSYVGADCQVHQLPVTDVTINALDTVTVNTTVTEGPANTFTISADVLTVPPAVFCTTVSALPIGPPGVAGVDVYVGADCQIHQLPANNICAELTALPIIPTEAQSNDYFVGVGNTGVCFRSLAPSICDQLGTIPVGPGSVVPGDLVLTRNGDGTCDYQAFPSPAPINICAELTALPIIPTEAQSNDYFIGVGNTGVCFRSLAPTICEQLATIPATVVPLVSGDLVLTRNIDGTCDYQPFPTVTGGSTTVVGVDTASVDVTVTELPAGTFNVSADVIAVPTDVLCDALTTLPFVGTAVPGVTELVGKNCSSYILPTPVNLVDCAGIPLVNGQPVITNSAFVAATSASPVAPRILIDAGNGCPNVLGAAPICGAQDLMDVDGANINAGFLVLAQGPMDTAPRWRILGGGLPFGGDLGSVAINVNDPTQSAVRYYSVTGNSTINSPIGDCSRTEIYIKNVSANPITITGLIDGVGVITLDGTIPGGYPFGANGGEAVHLVWNNGRGEWQIY